jgi:hypothetical protein
MGRTCPCHVNAPSISGYVLDPCGHVVGARIYSPRTSSGLVVEVVVVVAPSSSLYINDDEWQGNQWSAALLILREWSKAS